MPSLGVNIDHVATVRQARGADFPDVVEAALACQRAGARSIVAHLREDRRHIQDADIFRLNKALKIKFNVEASLDPSVLKTIERAVPDCVTFVPERRAERTTEGGVDVVAMRRRLARVIPRLHKRGIEVSLFIEPSERQIRASKAAGADAVEIHTGAYSNAGTAAARERLARVIEKAVRMSNELGLPAHVGHGLDYGNVRRIARIRGISEFNIGYSIISRSFFTGIGRAVRDMRRAIGA